MSYGFPRLGAGGGGTAVGGGTVAIAIDDAAPAFVAIEGGDQPGAFILTVRSSGTTVLAGPTLTAVSYDTGEQDYLTIGARSGNGPWSWTITCDTTGLGDGESTFSFDVEDTAATNSPQTVSGTLTIDAQQTQPVIELSTSTPSTSVEEGELSPEFTITAVNALGGLLPSLAVTTPSETWLTATVEADGFTITMQVDATSLTEGQEQATFDVECEEAAVPAVTVTVTANVTTDPALQLVEPVVTYNFGSIPEGSTTVNHRFNAVLNAGSGTIDPDATISAGDDWLSCSFTEEIAGQRYGIDIACDPDGQAAGPLSGTATISSTGSSDIVITVNATIAEVVPVLQPSTNAPSRVVFEGDTPTPYVLTITSNVVLAGPTASAVDYGSGPSGWLNVTTPTETSPGSGVWESTLSFSTSAFAAGSYGCSYTYSDANVPSGSVTIAPIVQVNDAGADIIDVPRTMDGTPIDPPTWAPFSTTTGLMTWSLTGGAFAEPTLPSASSLGSWAGTANLHLCPTFASYKTAVEASGAEAWPIFRQTGDWTQTTAQTVQYPVRTGAGWALTQTDQYASLPQAAGMNGQVGYGTRIDEALHLGATPRKWNKSNPAQAANRFANTAARYAFQGMNVENTATTSASSNWLYWTAVSGQTSATEPTDLLVAHCIVDGKSGTGVSTMTSGYWLNGNRACIRDGIVRGLRANSGHEEKVILGIHGTGNYLIFNQEHEARSIGILFGGAQNATAVQRNADILVSHCHHYRRPSWITSSDAAIKNSLIEVKSGIRVWAQAMEGDNERSGDQYHSAVFGAKPAGTADQATVKVWHCGVNFARLRNAVGLVNTINSYSEYKVAGVQTKFWPDTEDATRFICVRHVLHVSKFSPVSSRKGPRIGVGVTSDGPATDPNLTHELYAPDIVIENCTYYGTSSSFEHGCQGPVNNPTQVIGVYPRLIFRNNIDLDQAGTPTSGTCFFVSGNLPGTGAKALWDTTCGVDNYIFDRNYTRHSSGANRWGSLNNYIGGGVTRQNFTYANVSTWAFADLAGGDATITNPALQGTGTDGKDVGPDMPRLLAALAGSYGNGLTLGNAVRRFTPTG